MKKYLIKNYKWFRKICSFNFLSLFYKQKDRKRKTIHFFILSGIIISLVTTLIYYYRNSNDFNEAFKEIPEGTLVIKKNQIELTGNQEPIFIEKDQNIVVIDIQEEKYNSEILNNYEKGLFVNKEKIYFKNKEGIIDTFESSSLPEGIDLNKYRGEPISIFVFKSSYFISTFLFVFVYLIIGRAIYSFFWALIFWLFAKIIKLKEYNSYWQVYQVVINMYVLVSLGTIILILLNWQFLYYELIFFCFLFGSGFFRLINNKTKKNKVF